MTRRVMRRYGQERERRKARRKQRARHAKELLLSDWRWWRKHGRTNTGALRPRDRQCLQRGDRIDLRQMRIRREMQIVAKTLLGIVKRCIGTLDRGPLIARKQSCPDSGELVEIGNTDIEL